MDLDILIVSFLTLFIIMDPFASLGPFLAMTRKCTDEEVANTANKAVVIAGVVALVFLLGGIEVLNLLSVSLSDFKIAGGIVLMLLGLENVLSFSLPTNKDQDDGLESFAVLIATPMLSGPGLLTSLLFLTKENGLVVVIIALLFSLFFSWLILRNSVIIRKLLGIRVITVLSKVIGLVIIALGVSFLRSGILG
ncbi:MAG: MarC family protein [Candidatus Micrarchaeota archaeon]